MGSQLDKASRRRWGGSARSSPELVSGSGGAAASWLTTLLRTGRSRSSASQRSFRATLSACAQAAGRGLKLGWVGPLGSAGGQKSGSREVGPVRSTAFIRTWGDALIRWWGKFLAKYRMSTARRLRVAETISLGEKRFVAIVAVEGKEFLVGGGASGMSLLAELKTGGAAGRKAGTTRAGARKRVPGSRGTGTVAVGRVAAWNADANAGAAELAGAGGAK